MIIYEYANEQHIVHEFAKFTHTNKVKLPDGKEFWFFIWGYEVWLPEGGKQGFNGSIDLLASDESGNVWLIEAKQSANPELSSSIWDHQIIKYRGALSRRSHEEISMKTRRFLLRRGTTNLAPSFLNQECVSLFNAFEKWSKHIGRDSNFARQIYNQSLWNIKKEKVISTVMADVFRKDVWDGRPKDNKPYAYLVTRGTGENFEVRVISETRSPNTYINEYDYARSALDWAEISREKRKVRPAPDTVELYLTNRVSEYFKRSINELIKLGWNESYKSNQKAFIVDMPTKYGSPIRIHLGWVDFDASFSIDKKLPGELGLKFNIDFRHFKNSGVTEQKEIGYSLARRLAHEANYNGRGRGLHIQERDLTEDEKDSWDWEMYRRKDRENRDYLGRDDEEADFAAVWAFLNDIIV